jgi:DNA-binding HxlR family transcriptional regulator
MSESDNHTQKILDAVFDENISEILSEMETSPKKCEFLSEKFQLTPNDLDEKLSFLIQHEFVEKTGSDSETEYSVNSKKLAQLMETAHNFENVDAGLAKMDGYLN